MKKTAIRAVKGVKSVTDFLCDAVDAFKENSFVEAIGTALPWAKLAGEAAAEVLPPLKFITKIAEELLKETDPEKLGFTACTLAYQKAVEIAFKQVGGPTGERQSIKEAKDQLRELEHLEDIDMGTFSLETPQWHEFYTQATLSLQVAAIKVGYTQNQVDTITELVQENFRHSLTKLLSDGHTSEKFEPFTEYLKLGGADEKQARKLLAQHANYQRWLFEQAPVLRVSPFALKHVYIETDCGHLKWQDINESTRASANRINPFDEESGGRHPLLETVLGLIGSKTLTEAIIIQGIAGAGKSSFTLKLCDELLRRRLHPIRIRIKDLSFDKHIKDALPKAVLFGDEDYPEPEPFPFDNLFLNDSIFTEPGVGQYEHICKYILILDGWDEISLSDEGFKKKVAQILNQINDHYLKQKKPRIRVVLTGRPSSDIGETQCLRDETSILTIRRLLPEHLRAYISKIADAVNAEESLIKKNDQTEEWTVPPLSRFEPIFQKYETTFKAKGQHTTQQPKRQQISGDLDVLGLPLLTYLTVRLVAEWQGDLSPLLEDTTTLYRHLIDLTCKEAAKGQIGHEDGGNQHKIYGEELRQLLWQTAAAITMSGEENISRKELASRLDKEEEDIDAQASDIAKEIKLSSLLISFYFKGGHTNLGCEFAHKSFREYLFAEAIVESLKDFGRKQKENPAPRATYWEDFAENKPNDFRFEFSRRISEKLAPSWLTSEVKDHIQRLVNWEIERSVKPDNKIRPGTPTKPISLGEWKQVRTGLADLWEWWGEGVHLRPQAYKEKGMRKLKPAYVNELVEWHAPRDPRITSWRYVRTTTMDAHLGDALFHLCALVHGYMVGIGEDFKPTTTRKYQSIRETKDGIQVFFAPSGEHSKYFQNYIARINSAGWRQRLFPIGSFMQQIDLSGATLVDVDVSSTDLRSANLRAVNFHSGYLMGANLRGAFLEGAQLSGADLSSANLSEADLTGADLTGAGLDDADLSSANLSDADLTGADLTDAHLDGATLNGADLSQANLRGASFFRAYLKGAKLVEADLTDAKLNKADIGEAVLKGANLNGAALSGANLNDANIGSGLLFLSNAILIEIEKAEFDFLQLFQERQDRIKALEQLREIQTFR